MKIAKDGHIALGYLHGALEGMIVARHVGHDLTFVGLLVSQQVWKLEDDIKLCSSQP